MRFGIFLTVLIAAFMAFTGPVAAAESSPAALQESLLDLNRIKPLQNPKFEKSTDVLERRMLDRKNRVVGTIEDVMLNKNGNIASLNVNFSKIQLNRSVFINYNTYDIGTVTNGYAMESYEANDIKSIYPSLLANIETAAGEEDEIQSLKKLQNVDVVTSSGRRIGKVQEILFEGDGRRAAAVYVSLFSGAARGQGVAIPFRQVDFTETSVTHQIRISDDMADAMIAYAKG